MYILSSVYPSSFIISYMNRSSFRYTLYGNMEVSRKYCFRLLYFVKQYSLCTMVRCLGLLRCRKSATSEYEGIVDWIEVTLKRERKCQNLESCNSQGVFWFLYHRFDGFEYTYTFTTKLKARHAMHLPI